MSATATMTGWRVCGATGAGLISYSRLGDPVARVQDAVCDQGCATIPGPGCECGWYVCDSLADIRPLVATHQYHVDHGADHVALALVGVEITHPRHTPSPFNNRKGREIARRMEDITGVRHLTSIEGDGTWRGRRLTITGPIVTTLSNSAAIERLHRNYETDVISTPLRMLDVVDLLHAAGGTRSQTPARSDQRPSRRRQVHRRGLDRHARRRGDPCAPLQSVDQGCDDRIEYGQLRSVGGRRPPP